MIIQNNLAAIQSVNQLTRNLKDDKKAGNQLSTGEKFSGAGTGKSSEYNISEKMRIQLRSLNQCTDNTTKGRDMMDIAMEAVGEQVELMKKIRALSMKASDGVYSNEDRKIIQAEVNQMLDEVEELAQTTNFNEIPLLNKISMTDQTFWFDPNAPYRPIPSDVPVMPPAAAAPGGTWTVQQGDYIGIANPPTNIYDTSTVVAGNALTALPNVGDIVCDNTGAYSTVVNNGGILCFGAGGTTAITVNGIGGATATNVFSPTHPPLTTIPALGAFVGGSSIPAFGAGTPPTVITPTYEVKNHPGSGVLSFLQTGSNTSVAELEFDTLVTALLGKGLTIPQDLDELGFSLDCGACSQFVTVKFDADTDISNVYGGNPLSETRDPICYVIGVQSVTNGADLAAAVFNGLHGANGSGTSSVPSATDQSVKIAQAHSINLNYHAGTGKFTISKDGPTISYLNGIKGEMKSTESFQPHQNIALQTGTESSQYLNTRFPATTLAALFPSQNFNWDIDPKESDFPTTWPEEYEWNHKEGRPSTEVEKKQRWREEVWPYPAKRVNLETDRCVGTQASAARFIDDVDQAIKYLLAANTNLGSQASRLNFTEANLVTSNENEAAAESTIRDVNFAQAFTDKTRSNILAQAAQSMVAQANQAPERVLSLLQ